MVMTRKRRTLAFKRSQPYANNAARRRVEPDARRITTHPRSLDAPQLLGSLPPFRQATNLERSES